MTRSNRVQQTACSDVFELSRRGKKALDKLVEISNARHAPLSGEWRQDTTTVCDPGSVSRLGSEYTGVRKEKAINGMEHETKQNKSRQQRRAAMKVGRVSGKQASKRVYDRSAHEATPPSCPD